MVTMTDRPSRRLLYRIRKGVNSMIKVMDVQGFADMVLLKIAKLTVSQAGMTDEEYDNAMDRLYKEDPFLAGKLFALMWVHEGLVEFVEGVDAE